MDMNLENAFIGILIRAITGKMLMPNYLFNVKLFLCFKYQQDGVEKKVIKLSNGNNVFSLPYTF